MWLLVLILIALFAFAPVLGLGAQQRAVVSFLNNTVTSMTNGIHSLFSKTPPNAGQRGIYQAVFVAIAVFVLIKLVF